MTTKQIKSISFLAIQCLLLVQVFTFLHGVAHGFDDHEHNGHACTQLIHAETSADDALLHVAVRHFVPAFTIQVSLAKNSVNQRLITLTTRARAPPLTSTT